MIISIVIKHKMYQHSTLDLFEILNSSRVFCYSAHSQSKTIQIFGISPFFIIAATGKEKTTDMTAYFSKTNKLYEKKMFLLREHLLRFSVYKKFFFSVDWSWNYNRIAYIHKVCVEIQLDKKKIFLSNWFCKQTLRDLRFAIECVFVDVHLQDSTKFVSVPIFIYQRKNVNVKEKELIN